MSRSLHSSSSRRLLVGPPDPVSHLRPVIYGSEPTQSRVQHPYSLREFRDMEEQADEHENDFGNYELKLRMARMDAFNHEFWAEVSFSASTLHAFADLQIQGEHSL
jgi:apoptogenic protein 1